MELVLFQTFKEAFNNTIILAISVFTHIINITFTDFSNLKHFLTGVYKSTEAVLDRTKYGT